MKYWCCPFHPNSLPRTNRRCRRSAKSKNARIEVLDTQLVSIPLGFQILTAAKAATDGANLAEYKQIAARAYGYIGEYFMVNTLEYLHRDGRIGGAKRLPGSSLNIKPILKIYAGRVESIAKELPRHRAFSHMLKLAEAEIANRRPLRISISHTGAPEAGLDFKEQAEQYFQPDEIHFSKISPVIGVIPARDVLVLHSWLANLNPGLLTKSIRRINFSFVLIIYFYLKLEFCEYT